MMEVVLRFKDESLCELLVKMTWEEFKEAFSTAKWRREALAEMTVNGKRIVF